ncbi:hypothetical protein L915_19656 [Phytophthora nicotianae]|uniref:K Homology domain-containing protein n=1 Tax=Phytophthora nicotianae TaxID=4792 RepID=W2FS16_PHYNI|nr:hypothetical protein L915_19656 [Phytophthora nicotianae]
MELPFVAPSSADTDDAGRKSKLLALLDRARVNRGLQPEQNGDTVDEEQVMDYRPPPIKTEPTDIKSEQINDLHQQQHTPKCTCNHSHQSSPVSTNNASQALPASGRRERGFNGISTPDNESSASHTTVTSTGSSINAMFINSEVVGGSLTVIQTAGEDARQSDTSHASTARVAVLSSAPKPRIADLTGGRDKVPRLQQLKPLEVPRNPTHQPHLEEKRPMKRELPARDEPKQPRTKPSNTNTSLMLKKLELLTPDEYEDSELHGDFQHMLHILIPSNATTALLERRGQPIQSISQQSDCTLSIREPEASPFKDDRLLRIYGKAKGISLAQRLVIAYIRAYRADKGDPNYMDLTNESPPVALPATSITKAMSVAVSGKKNELEFTSPFVWMVPREDVGKMMGRQGSILAAIRQNTGAAIHLDKDSVPGTSERRVVLIGTVNSIAAAIEEIKARSGGHPEVSASPSGRLGQYFAIPYHTSGFLIGPQGSTVKSITERTGARLQIPSAEDLPLGSVNRILHMQGAPKEVEHARRVVGAKLRDYLASNKCPQTVTPISTGRKGDKVTIKTLLPSRICGFMLDNRGKLIREISEKSGAHTHLLAPHDDESRVCVFNGEMSCVLRAQRLVLQVIAGDAISSKHTAIPRKRKRSQREEEYSEVEDKESYESDVEEDYEEYEEPPRRPVRQTVRRVPIRSRHDFEDEDMYRRDEGHEERPRRPIRRPVTRPREYVEEYHDYDHEDYDHDEYHEERVPYDVPYSRIPKRPIVRRQPRRHQEEYDSDYQEYDDYSYEDDSDDYEHSLIARKQAIKRRAIGSRPDRRPAVLPGRKVQMVAPRLSPREQRPRVGPTDRRRPSSASLSRGSVSVHHSGRGTGRPSSSRGRGNGKRRRQ